MSEEFSNEILEKFTHFAAQGISEVDISAASGVLCRELGRRPTIFEMAEYLDDFIQWRRSMRKWKAGEITISYKYTTTGETASKIESEVNKIFMKGSD